jgi:hypothetical protein
MVADSQSGSIRAYARSRRERGLLGGTHQAVRLQIARGFLSPAVLQDGQLDFARADALWSSRNGHEAADRAPRAGRHGPVPPRGVSEARLAQARAGKAELELAAQRGEQWPADEVRAAAADAGRKVRDIIEAIPGRCSAILAGESDPQAIGQLLAGELGQALDAIEAWCRSPEARA